MAAAVAGCPGRRGGVPVRRYDYHNYNDDDEDEDYDFSNYGYCGLGAVPWSSNMDIIMVWAWMLWSSDAVKQERYYGLGMDALVIRCSRT